MIVIKLKILFITIYFIYHEAYSRYTFDRNNTTSTLLCEYSGDLQKLHLLKMQIDKYNFFFLSYGALKIVILFETNRTKF